MPLPPLDRDDLDHVVRQTGGLWLAAKGARIFITGGTGFFGCWLLESFVHANRELGLGAEVTIVTRDIARFAAKAPHLAGSPEIRVLAADMRDLSVIEGEFDYAIHAASETYGYKNGQLDPLFMFERNIDGTRQFLSLVKRAKVRRFLYVSSGAAYGTQPVDMPLIQEDHCIAPNPILPSSANGEGKRCSELLCSLIGNGKTGTEGVAARCFTFVGPLLPIDYGYAIGNFIRDAMAGGPLHIGGDGTPLRSYLYASDLATWLWTILFKGQTAQAYNVGSEESVSIYDLARTVRNVLSPKAEIIIAQQARPGVPPQRYLPSTEKARNQLGLNVEISLQDAIRRTADWHNRISKD